MKLPAASGPRTPSLICEDGINLTEVSDIDAVLSHDPSSGADLDGFIGCKDPTIVDLIALNWLTPS